MYRNVLAKAAASGELSKKNGRRLRLYFVGIGGSGMYPLARFAHALGYAVSGADARENENTRRLSLKGIPVCIGKEPLPKESEALVISLAVPDTHPTVCEANERGVPVFTRAELLALLERRFPVRVAVAGSHGKSSTVGMCAAILGEAGLSPTVLVGADLTREEGGFRKGEGSILLYEACEYENSFHAFSPTHAAVLNAEWEHTDFFASEEEVSRSFRAFLEKNTVRYRLCERALPFSRHADFGEGALFHAEEVTEKDGVYAFSLLEGERVHARITLGVIGAYQVENALAASALALSVGADAAAVGRGLSAFRGVAGRMEHKGRVGQAPLYLDYAHHPTELAAALSAASRLGERVVCVFEPHTYSRVHAFEGEFVRLLSGGCFGVLPIYAAREENIFGVSSERLAQKSGAVFLKDYASAADFLKENSADGTVLLLVGAGTVGETVRYLTV